MNKICVFALIILYSSILHVHSTVRIDGTLDQLFANNGVESIENGLFARLNRVVIQTDGKIIAAGTTLPTAPNNRLMVVRFNTDGSLDTSFANDGIMIDTRFAVKTDQATLINATRLVLQKDGKIIVGTNRATTDDLIVARYNPDGTPDTSFNQTGFIIISYGVATEYLGALALNDDGSILVAGRSNQTVIIKILPHGQLDVDFGTNGSQFLPITADVLDMEILHDNKFVMCGRLANDFIVIRCNQDGTIDTTFGTQHGYTTTSVGANDFAICMSVQGDGKIIIAGQSNPGGTFIFVLIRYTADGQLDASFATGGIFQQTVGTSSLIGDIKIQSDGKIIFAGHTTISAIVRATTARLLSNGTIDRSFGIDGYVTTNIPAGNTNRNLGCAIQPDNKIVCVGDSFRADFITEMRIERLTCDSLIP